MSSVYVRAVLPPLEQDVVLGFAREKLCRLPIADPKVMELGAIMVELRAEEEELRGEVTSRGRKIPLPQPGDMHVRVQKSSLLIELKTSKIELIPFVLLQENKQEIYAKGY